MDMLQQIICLINQKKQQIVAITYYCSCAICCGRVSHTTASGAPTVEGVTVAADPSIPFGTKLKINGHVYTVQDRGGAMRGNHIDIYVSSHSRALSQTYTRGPVYKVKYKYEEG